MRRILSEDLERAQDSEDPQARLSQQARQRIKNALNEFLRKQPMDRGNDGAHPPEQTS